MQKRKQCYQILHRLFTNIQSGQPSVREAASHLRHVHTQPSCQRAARPFVLMPRPSSTFHRASSQQFWGAARAFCTDTGHDVLEQARKRTKLWERIGILSTSPCATPMCLKDAVQKSRCIVVWQSMQACLPDLFCQCFADQPACARARVPCSHPCLKLFDRSDGCA